MRELGSRRTPAVASPLCPIALSLALKKFGGADGSRTHDLLNAIQALSQLSYGPTLRYDSDKSKRDTPKSQTLTKAASSDRIRKFL